MMINIMMCYYSIAEVTIMVMLVKLIMIFCEGYDGGPSAHHPGACFIQGTVVLSLLFVFFVNIRMSYKFLLRT
jgi:hypothetical protein